MGGRPRVAPRAFFCTLDDCRLGALTCSYVIYGVSMWEGGWCGRRHARRARNCEPTRKTSRFRDIRPKSGERSKVQQPRARRAVFATSSPGGARCVYARWTRVFSAVFATCLFGVRDCPGGVPTRVKRAVFATCAPEAANAHMTPGANPSVVPSCCWRRRRPRMSRSCNGAGVGGVGSWPVRGSERVSAGGVRSLVSRAALAAPVRGRVAAWGDVPCAPVEALAPAGGAVSGQCRHRSRRRRRV